VSAPAIVAVPRGVPRAARTHLRLLVNPRASRLREGDAALVARILQARFALSTAYTAAGGHATELAREAARDGYDLVAVLGGDGVVSEAAGGLVGSPTPLACLPAGVTNVFARAIGMPRTPLAAAAALNRLAATGLPATRRVDVGTVNGRHFLYTAGVGFSAAMTAAADRVPGRKARLGQLAFVGAAATEIAGRYLREPPRMRVRAPGFDEEGVTVMAQNCHALTYFGPRAIALSGAAGLDTGGLALTVLRRSRPRDVAGVVARLLAGRPDAVAGHPQIAAGPLVPTATVTSVSREPLPLEADGEFLGAFQRIEFGVRPSSLTVIG